MKLAIVCQRYTAYGGAERFVARSLPALEGAGAEVTLITRSEEGWGARRVLRVDPFYLGNRWRDRSFARAARKLWQREGFDLVQSHDPIPGCDVYRPGEGVYLRRLEIRRRSAALSARIGLALGGHSRYLCRAEKDVIEHPRLRAVICPSGMVRDEVRRAFRVVPEKLHVIYDGVDLEYFHPREGGRLRGAARAELGCGRRDTVFMLISRDFTRQRVDAAITALAAPTSARHWLLVVGEDSRQSRAKRLARAKGVAERVRFMGRQDDLRPLYAAADCVVLPSRYDPFPQAGLEALAMGVPLIVSTRCGTAEIIEPGVSGWICEPDDPVGLRRAMQAADEAAGDGRAGAAARAVAERFGVDAMTRQLTDLYANLRGAG